MEAAAETVEAGRVICDCHQTHSVHAHTHSDLVGINDDPYNFQLLTPGDITGLVACARAIEAAVGRATLGRPLALALGGVLADAVAA